jgi:hypothetical protein
MLLSIKSIAALSIIPLSFAKYCSGEAEKVDFCNLGEFFRLETVGGELTEYQLVDAVQNPLCAPDCCPIIAGQVGVPVCHANPIVKLIPSDIVIAHNNYCPNISPANVLSRDQSVFRCVSYYHFPGSVPFNCASGFTAVCRYCALQDYTPELSRNLFYIPNSIAGTLLASAVAPFRCGAPKCPAFTVVPGSNPTKYARLSAAYCVSSGDDVTAVTTPYADIWQNFACHTGLSQGVINQKWGCYIQNNLTASFPGSTPGSWCDGDYVPYCFYDVSKPYSYPPFFTS